MGRLIDADAFIRYIDPGHLRSQHEVCFSESDVVKMIDKQPTIEEEHVKHGRWERVIPTKSAAKWSTKVSCSVCHKQGYTYYNHCPNCGAKMDGE